MTSQLILGFFVVSLTMAAAAGFIVVAIRVLRLSRPWLSLPPHDYKTIIVLTAVSIWLLVANVVGVWMWALAFVWLDLCATLEAAVYFSFATLTTLGYGDVTLPKQWRILSGICAANGLLLFGLSAAFLFELFRRLHTRSFENQDDG